MTAPDSASKLALWGGVECTINRVAGSHYHQLGPDGAGLDRTDLERAASLGIRALRFPVLWEQHEPVEGGEIDWRWAEDRLEVLRERGIMPIVGLVHHGSGPGFTSLVDPGFSSRLARYARLVAERFPWVRHFTPVNEPLTTARFAALYGHWYPHARDPASFVRALLNQIRGTVLAMRAIREVIPDARLVQTEDIGEVFSTPALRYQADFENARRWLSFDLLCGHLDVEHPVWGYLRGSGMTDAEREWFARETCPPDIVGLNHYMTSNRYLDEDLSKYPPCCHGGNGRDAYADTEAVRARPDGVPSPAGLLRAAWERYGLPLAVTEVHLACTREEQMRWFMEIWDAARHLRDEEVDVRAVTAWSLFGARDWDSLLTVPAGHYEAGVFDRRASPPRETALAPMLRELARTGTHEHPLLGAPGWWRRSVRLAPGVASPAELDSRSKLRHAAIPQRFGGGPHHHAHRESALLLITGGEGPLAQAYARICFLRGIPYRLLTRRELDPRSLSAIRGGLDAHQPWALVHAARLTADLARREESTQWDVTLHALAGLTEECARRGVGLMTFSGDEVFDGHTAPIRLVETTPMHPRSPLGRLLAAAEGVITRANPDALIVRTGPTFGPWDRASFAAQTSETLAQERVVLAGADETISPTYLVDLAHASLDLLIDGAAGPWHLVNGDAVTWAQWARRLAERGKLDPARVQEAHGPACFRALATERGQMLPALDDALARFVAVAPRERELAAVE